MIDRFHCTSIDPSHLYFFTQIPTCFKQEPKEHDKLSPSEFEEAMEEVMKSYQDGDATKDPYMSPLLAPDELLSGLPPVHIVVSTYL